MLVIIIERVPFVAFLGIRYSAQSALTPICSSITNALGVLLQIQISAHFTFSISTMLDTSCEPPGNCPCKHIKGKERPQCGRHSCELFLSDLCESVAQ